MTFSNELKKVVYSGKLKLEYNEEGTGQPLILLHGLFGNLGNWSETISFFSQSHRVITPILPIFEASQSKDALNDLVEYVHTLVVELELNNVILAGNSLGGHVAVLYTLAHPETVDHLVLIGSAGLYESTLGISYPKRGNYDYIADRVRYTFYNKEVVSPALIEEVFSTVNDLRKSINILKIAKATNRSSVANDLGKIKTPTLLLWGEQDLITPLDVAIQFKELLGGKVELHTINNCGHAPMMEQPYEFNYILNNYLKKYSSEEIDVLDRRLDRKIA